MTVVLGILRAIGWRGAIIAIVAIFAIGWHLSAVSQAHEAGAQSVRLQWQEANRRAELAALERQKRQQAEVNQAEAELMAVQTQAAMRRRALEAALEAERADESKPVVDRSVCRLPDRVRDALKY